MTNFSKPINRALFVLCVIVTGSIAGAFVWAFFFLMDKGIELFWATLPALIGQAADAYLPGLAEGRSAFCRIRLSCASAAAFSSGISTRKRARGPKSLPRSWPR